MTPKDYARIDDVEAVRSLNNTLWMSILRIALEKAPDETKVILRQINVNDRTIGDLLLKLGA
jgi:hypothetical protein